MKSLKGSTLVLWIVFLVFLCGAVMAQRGSKRGGNHGPKMVVLPITVKCESSQIVQEVKYLAYDYLKRMDFTIIAGEKVQRAIKEIGFSLPDYSRSKVSFDKNDQAKFDTEPVLKRDSLLDGGDYYKAQYAMGVYAEIAPKTTRHIKGQRQNGRCKLWVVVADVAKGEIVYRAFSGEIGAAQSKNGVATAFTGLGILSASGIIGGGHRTKDLGWAMIATPHVSRLDPGSNEDLMFQATSKAAQETFEDVWSGYLDWTK